MNRDGKKALQIFRDGGVVIFPTDTAFGIGCRIDDEKSIDRLFLIRKRPADQATPVLVSSIDMARRFVTEIPHYALNLMNRHWPGALTIILPAKVKKISSKVRGGGNTIGLREPGHDELREIIEALGVPVLGPSANIHGEKTPYLMEDLDPALVSQVDFILPGTCLLKTVSTVVDCTAPSPVIVRQGAVEL